MLDNHGLLIGGRIFELDGDEALAGGVLQILLNALIAGIVGDDQQKSVVRLDYLAALFDRQDAPMVRERMDQNRCVFARLDDLVEVANGAAANRLSQRTIDPDSFIRLNQKTADQIAASEIFMAGNGD